MAPSNNNTLDFSALREEGTEAAAQLAAIAAIVSELCEDKCNDAQKMALVKDGLIPALVDALKRPENQYGQFFHQTFSIFTLLPGFDQSKPSIPEIAAAVMDDGGLESVIEFMKSENGKNDGFTIYTCFGVLMSVMAAFDEAKDEERCLKLALSVLPVIVDQIERHGMRRGVTTSTSLFTVGCDLVQFCLRPGNETPADLYMRMVKLAWHGFSFHRDDEEAQSNGRDLLCRLVGPEEAVKMIDHVEMHHCEDANCSCAA